MSSAFIKYARDERTNERTERGRLHRGGEGREGNGLYLCMVRKEGAPTYRGLGSGERTKGSWIGVGERGMGLEFVVLEGRKVAYLCVRFSFLACLVVLFIHEITAETAAWACCVVFSCHYLT